jgi:hypothetical protein
LTTLINTESQLVNLVSALGATPAEIQSLIATETILTNELTQLGNQGVPVTDPLFSQDVTTLVTIEGQLASLLTTSGTGGTTGTGG